MFAGTTLAIAAVAGVAGVVGAGHLAGQTRGDARAGRNEITLTAEPIAAGARYLRGAASGFRFGASLTIGPLHGVTLVDADTGKLDEWATMYALIGVRWAGGIQVSLGPGASLAIGDDFSSLYPSGRADLEWASGRFRVGTAVSTMRIASSYGAGDFWVRWIPVRLGIAFD
jgi:hypothetical protein